MIKVNIKKNNAVTNSATFTTQELADAWLSREVANNSFGKNERWVGADSPELTFDSVTGDITNSLEARTITIREAIPAVLDSEGVEITPEVQSIAYVEHRLAAEYVVEIIDITVQVEQERINQEALAYLASTDWMVIRAAEGGIAVPADITAARITARLNIVR